MEINVYRDQNKKGLGTTDIFNVIPRGKKGEVVNVPIGGGILTFEWGADITEADVKIAVVMLSLFFQGMGHDTLKQITERQVMLPVVDKDDQAQYTPGVKVNSGDISALLNKGNRKRAKRVVNSLKKLEKLCMTYTFPEKDDGMVIRLFSRPAWKKGVITFDIANFLINRTAETLKAFRLPPLLDSSGFESMLALYVETRQRKYGTYKDEDGITRNSYVPLNEYKLADIVRCTKISGAYTANPRKTIKKIQDAFNERHKREPGFPKFTYEPRREVFESQYKNGLKGRVQ